MEEHAHGHVFTYEEHGAYHWHGTYPGKILRSSPQLRAHYDLPLRLLERFKPVKDSIGLDVGSGDGVLLYKAQKAGGLAVGLEINSNGLKLAREKLEERGKNPGILVHGTGDAIPAKDLSFDYVVAIEVIEHLEDAKQFLSEVKRVLRKDGVFVCTTPCRPEDRPFPTNPFHVFEYDHHDLRAELLSTFSTVKVYGMRPPILDLIYVDGFGLPSPFSKLCRFAFKIAAAVLNPYTYVVQENPGPNWRTLVATAQR